MAVTYNATLKNTRMTDVLTAIGNAGKVKVYTTGGSASGTLLASFTLPTPSGAVAADVLTLDADPDISATAGNTGTAAVAEITTSADVLVVSGMTVGTSGTDVIISPSTTITSGQTVNLLTFTLTHG